MRLPPDLEKIVLPIMGKEHLSNLYPPQKEALSNGALEGKNLLLCTGTGSGKTLVAELAAINTVLKGKKVIYITPLRALAGEKFEEFRKYAPTIQVALSMGGLDENDNYLSGKDIIFLTTEKLDALMRHRSEWIREVGLLVVDEIHEIGSDRGPTLESVIVKMRRLVAQLQVLALSATVGNAEELAKWLGANLVESDFRPVPLREGVVLGREIRFSDGKRKAIPGEGAEGAVSDCLKDKYQCLTFLNTRKSAEKSAEDLGKITAKYLKKEDKVLLEKLSEGILEALPSPTTQCERLAACVKSGSAFHHAGLVHAQKTLIEDAFRKGVIRSLSATVTLVAGMNLPARRIIIKSLSTWSSDGPRDWPVSLYKQAAGRAGRPGYDSLGEAIVVSKSEAESDLIIDKYIKGSAEDVLSRLGAQPVLRREVLGAIASGFAPNVATLLDFFGSTFYAHQYGDISRIRSMILEVLEELRGWGFVEGAVLKKTSGGFSELGSLIKKQNEEIVLTKIGRRVAELYIDPLTAHEIIEAISSGEERQNDPFSYLLLVSNTFEMRPGPSVRAKEEEMIWKTIGGKKLLSKAPEPWDVGAVNFAKAAKLAIALESWISEEPDREIMEKFNIAPGDLRTKLVNADWVCYSASELAKLSGRKKTAGDLLKLQARLEHGIKEELLPLMALRGIGRVRARKLFAFGLKNPEAVLNTEKKKLGALIGEKTAEKLLRRN